MHSYTMNITYRHLLLISASLSLSACGQFGSLYLPGHGSGYYAKHPFTERPIHAVEPITTTKPKVKPKTTTTKPVATPAASTTTASDDSTATSSVPLPAMSSNPAL